MKRAGLAWLLFGGGFVFSAAAFGLSVQVDSLPTLMSRGDYAVARQGIDSETRQALGLCRALETGEARGHCRVRARAEDRVKKADLAARYYGTVAAAREARQARVKASFDVARSQCSGRIGPERTACVAAARRDEAGGTAIAAGST